MNPIRILLRDSIDYAGLFPPAGLGMSAAVANYAEYATGREAWALGRFVVPASRLAEWKAAVGEIAGGPNPERWRLSVLAGPDTAEDLNQIARLERSPSGPPAPMTVESIEVKAGTPAAVEETLSRIPRRVPVYVEFPSEGEPGPLLAAAARVGARAKVRTGGVTPQAFPSPANLSRFIHACVGARVPFKATAGLHHALRAEYRLTYEEDCGTGAMFGFLNLFLATALACTGGSEHQIRDLLETRSSAALRLDDSGVVWNRQRFDLDLLARSRESLISFGSCSFTEPIAELQSLGWLESQVRQA